MAPELQSDDPHQIMINRLNFELSDRKNTAQLYSNLKSTKFNLIKSTKEKLKVLVTLDVDFEKIVESAKDLEQKLGETSILQTNDESLYLSTPLFALYKLAVGYAQINSIDEII